MRICRVCTIRVETKVHTFSLTLYGELYEKLLITT